jgi:hypothetical protein
MRRRGVGRVVSARAPDVHDWVHVCVHMYVRSSACVCVRTYARMRRMHPSVGVCVCVCVCLLSGGRARDGDLSCCLWWTPYTRLPVWQILTRGPIGPTRQHVKLDLLFLLLLLGLLDLLVLLDLLALLALLGLLALLVLLVQLVQLDLLVHLV